MDKKEFLAQDFFLDNKKQTRKSKKILYKIYCNMKERKLDLFQKNLKKLKSYHTTEIPLFLIDNIVSQIEFSSEKIKKEFNSWKFFDILLDEGFNINDIKDKEQNNILLYMFKKNYFHENNTFTQLIEKYNVNPQATDIYNKNITDYLGEKIFTHISLKNTFIQEKFKFWIENYRVKPKNTHRFCCFVATSQNSFEFFEELEKYNITFNAKQEKQRGYGILSMKSNQRYETIQYLLSKKADVLLNNSKIGQENPYVDKIHTITTIKPGIIFVIENDDKNNTLLYHSLNNILESDNSEKQKHKELNEIQNIIEANGYIKLKQNVKNYIEKYILEKNQKVTTKHIKRKNML